MSETKGSVRIGIEELERLRERLHGDEAVHISEMRELVDILPKVLSAAKPTKTDK